MPAPVELRQFIQPFEIKEARGLFFRSCTAWVLHKPLKTAVSKLERVNLSSPMLVSVLALILLAVINPATIAAPASEFLSPRAPAIYAKVEPDPNDPLWTPSSNVVPQPIRGTIGATIVGPKNVDVELQNPDTFAPPTTDEGQVPNLKWPFTLSHNRLSNGGWSRGQNGMCRVNPGFRFPKRR